jgi:SAM-dependent methyltransferase
LAELPATRILDIGCSGGWLGDVVPPGAKLFGVDIPPGPPGNELCTFSLADGRALPFPDASFDVAVLLEVIEHVPAHSEPRLLAEAYRVLCPGGTLLLSTPHRHPVAKALDPAWWLTDHRHYSASDIAALLTEAGFTDPAVDLVGGLWSSLYLPLFCVMNFFGRRAPFEASWRRLVTADLRRPGWHTVVAVSRK